MDSQCPNNASMSQDTKPKNRIVIVGAGIVGSAIAKHLSVESTSFDATVIDRSLNPLVGSTAYAPGFIGQVNEIDILTTLAVESVRQYCAMDNAFANVGGLEIASTPEGIENLEKRAQLAENAGLRASLLSSAEAATLVPQFHQMDQDSSALLFEGDGTVDAQQITLEYQSQAKINGVKFTEAKVESIVYENGDIKGVSTSSGFFNTSNVIVAAGIWTSKLLNPLEVNLPIIPVAHPYVKGAPRPTRSSPSPFVRYPEHHLYARDHGSFDGFGSYNHRPIVSEMPSSTATDPWKPEFDHVIANAVKNFPQEGSSLFSKESMNPVNGVFAVTPDGVPFIGQLEGLRGLWVAAAIWITHAGGAADLLAKMMRGEPIDEEMRKALDPNRFHGGSEQALKEKALGLYNDIYNLKRKAL